MAILEIGRTGGFYHIFDKEKNLKFANGKPSPSGMQDFYNSSNSPCVEANFMNYTSEAVKAGTLGLSVNGIIFLIIMSVKQPRDKCKRS
jgi:hypothetical protein